MRSVRSLVLIAFAGMTAAESAQAVCNAIPAATQTFRGALGTLNRPFASPGDFVGVEVNRGICDGSSVGLTNVGADHVVTVLFTPPPTSGSTPSAVVIAPSCPAIAAQFGQFSADLATLGGQAACVEQAPDQLFVRDERGEAGNARRRLFFEFPDSAGMFGLPGDHTLAGPAKIVVTSRTGALPSALVRESAQPSLRS